MTVPIIIINSVVFLLWNFSAGSEALSNFMIRNFLVSWTNVQEGRVWTLLTAAFSHSLFLHFLLNMFVLNSFGPVVERVLGPTRFLKFYLVASVFSSFCHIVVSVWLLNQPELYALGASGAISGVVLLFSLMFPKEKILILGIVPIPAFWGAVVFVGLDIWGLLAQVGGHGLPIGHGVHLGGALVGFIYYFFFLRRNRRLRPRFDLMP